jgi:Flp pilus assembly protein TadD
MKTRILWIVGGVVVTAAILAAALVYWRQAAATSARERAYTTAEKAANDGRWAEARAILEDQTRKRGRAADPAAQARWQKLEFRVAGGLKDFAAIEALAGLHPELVATDETTALWLWRLRSAARDEPGAAAVRAVWQNRGKDTVGWMCAEVDRLVNSGRREDARKLLAGATAVDAAAVPLVMRRALLADTPAELQRAFEQAYRLDPTNADLRSLRASALESVGQPAYARVDYVAALLADPRNPMRRDELASFYLRQGNLPDAVATWREGLGPLSPDFLWERALFWGRVIGQAAPDMALAGESRRTRFAGWLAAMPADKFWDEAGYGNLHLPAAHAQREPAVTWLRLLEFVRTGDLTSALATLQQAPAVAVATAPALHAALRLTLAVRTGAKPVDTGIAWPVSRGAGHRWWDVLGAASRGDRDASAELTGVATGPQAVVATLLAAGWTGPACALADWAQAAKLGTPGWVQFGLLQARRMVEGPAKALVWAEGLPPVPEIELVRAELQLGAGRTGEATKTLQRLATLANDTGYAAGWTLAIWLLEQGEHLKAAEVVAGSPQLRGTIAGTELRARCLLAGGRAAEAKTLYESIADNSLEAGAYLARQAFSRRDWAEARRLTEYWLGRLPDNLVLRANLEAIATAERGGGRP